MSKYLFILPNFNIGGAERVSQSLLMELVNDNIKYDLFFLSSAGDKENWKEFRYEVLEKSIVRSIFTLFRRKLQYDYSFTSHYFINYLVSFLKITDRLNVQYMIFRESTPFFSRYRLCKRIIFKICHSVFYKHANKIIFQSDTMKREFLENVTSCKLVPKIVVYNPLSTKRIDFLVNVSQSSRFTVGNYWLALGRLIPEKGFDILISAYAKYYSHDFLPLFIFGNGPEDYYLRSLIKKYSLTDKVFLYSYTSNPYRLIQNADACILPSRVEGFPNLLNEMVYLNEKVLCSICVDEISKLSFVLKCVSDDVDSLGVSLLGLLRFEPLSSAQRSERNIYLNSLNPRSYFINVFSKN